jgi:D-arginine dehydrogenase
MMRFDVLVIGAGAAGASVAYELSKIGRVAIIEQESAPAYHSTARSAAVLCEAYGPIGWQMLTSASRAFFENPPEGLAEHALLRPLGALFLATADEEPSLRTAADELERRGVSHALMPAAAAAELCPVVRTGDYARALYEPGCADIDSNALVQGYLRLARRNGAEIVLATEASRIVRQAGLWRVATNDAEFAAPLLVNAAGAWAGLVANRAGLPSRGLVPYRRTAITFDPPAGIDAAKWPMVFDVAETWYFKPEGGRIMASPVDKTLSPPCDCAPEDLDVAIAVDRIEHATTMRIRRIHRKWAGLRTFVPDNDPVIGPDPEEPSFVWLAGQGGNGVMAAPAAARLAAALAMGEEVPGDIAGLGVTAERVSPARLASQDPTP